MANPTTNYGFIMPTSTDLVTDLPADFDVFGQAVDTQMLTNANAAIAKTIVDAKGDIIAATAADTVSRLAVGANDTVLTADSTQATGLKWATPSSGGMTLLSTTTLSGASVSISVTPTGYTALQMYIKDAYGSTNDVQCRIRFNSDTGSTYGYGAIRQAENSVSAVGEIAANSIPYILNAIPSNDSANRKGYAFVNIMLPNSTANVTVNWQSSSSRNDQISGHVTGTGIYDGTAAITSIQFSPGSGNWSGGTVYLYGVK